MSNYGKLADDLMHFLDLSLPPIAISFSDRIPAGAKMSRQACGPPCKNPSGGLRFEAG